MDFRNEFNANSHSLAIVSPERIRDNPFVANFILIVISDIYINYNYINRYNRQLRLLNITGLLYLAVY